MTIETYLQEMASRYQGRALIVGKGPSYAEFRPENFRDHFVVGLNEVALDNECDAAFVIDGDILEANGVALLKNIRSALITPRVLHGKRINLGGLTLYGPGATSAVDTAWRREAGSRHRCFNLSTVEPDATLGAVYAAYNFSAPTLASLLIASGFHRIGLAGIDGGTAYSPAFGQFEFKKLKSVQSSFDAQFADFRKLRETSNVDFFSVRCTEPYVLIGAEPEQVLAEEVLKWSIDRNTFLRMRYLRSSFESRELYAAGTAGTPFSFQRLFLPAMSGGKGRGLYFDSDMLVFRDVYELFNMPMEGNVLLGCEATLGRRAQYSVFLVDNERANWDPVSLVELYRAGMLTYEALMRDFCFAAPKALSLPQYWNSLEIHEPGVTANIHYTDMGTQPWLSIYNRNAALWCEALFRALEVRPQVGRALATSIERGWVRPSLAWQVERQLADPWRMPRSVKRLDADWLPPHISLRPNPSPHVLQLMKWSMVSRVRRVLQSRTYGRMVKLRHAIRKVF